MSSIHERRVAALGLSTRVLESGPSNAQEAVVFLHGQPGSAEDWAALQERVAPLGRTVSFDWPGWGSAERPTRSSWDFSAGASATFMAAILDELGIRRAHLVMHDLGGVGLLWGAAHPGAFASAVLIDTGALIGFRWHSVAKLMRVRLIGDALLPLATRTTFRAFLRYYNPQPRPLPENVIDRWWESFSLPTRRAMLAFYRATPEKAFERLVEPLNRLDLPALVVWGAHDPAVPVEQARNQLQSFPRAEIAILDQSGHWPYLDDPDRTAELVIPFLQRQLDG